MSIGRPRTREREPVPPGILAFQKYAGIPGSCPHPVVVLEVVPEHVMKSFIETMNAPNVIVKEERRRIYMAILADEVMNQNPIKLQHKGRDVGYFGEA